ncbi:hypothetical protein ACFC1R_37720 [Kitasatospora sp. NPDC056138]|uniref:hypothetical protein n=1 Tax=Kitasatospora sp. NPDC056138 TaxID=3345724 RepID=UPI0035D7E5F4
MALGSPDDRSIMVVPLVGWQSVREGEPRSIDNSLLEPVVLFDNVNDPIITTVNTTLTDWRDGSYLHQILAPGFEVRELPEGWRITEYGD